MSNCLLFIHALSSLHAGTGQGVGAIDLPIAREKATGVPFVPGSTIKGVLRDLSEGKDPARTVKVFGPPPTNAEDHAGSLLVSDARLLLLPVRSVAGTFAWVTSPYLLRRLMRDATGTPGLPTAVPAVSASNECLIAQTGNILALDLNGTSKVCLEDIDLEAKTSPSTEVDAWLTFLKDCLFPNDTEWQRLLGERLCIVHDDVMSFLVDTATEVRPRIRLDADTKTVVRGQLWYEEALPAESVLVSVAAALPVKKAEIDASAVLAHVKTLADQPMQLGGKATVGYGICRVQYVGVQGDQP